MKYLNRDKQFTYMQMQKGNSCAYMCSNSKHSQNAQTWFQIFNL